MKTLGDAFVEQLHRDHLKQVGFRKTRHTFVRSHELYTEQYQIQGSAWNDRPEPWTCYLNCGIGFDGVAPRNPDRDFPRTHAWMRAGVFVADARSQYDVTIDSMTVTAAEVADVIRRCSHYFQRRHSVLRDCYENGRYERGFLADPELHTHR
jgi:hypothetical protein